jgi:signal transduction histidine kinase
MKRLIAQLFQLVRDVATALRPPILDAGIASAIEWQARRFERARRSLPGAGAGQSASIERCQGHRPVPYPAGGADQRHAPCPGAHVEIELVHEDGQLRMTVSDDGVGFAARRRGRPRSAWWACASGC